ncbi:hypothetical protein ACIGMX_12980 [Streptomyces aquilus]|uniref:hypothetical protein n=1 Tax=Streptomyces aquilus TaxID=2548456 RepID=UPI0037D87A97
MTHMWMPLSVRQGAGEVVQDELSPVLATALRRWVERAVRNEGIGDRIMLRCELFCGPDIEADDADFVAWCTPEEQLLDVVDAVLDLLPVGIPTQPTPPSGPGGGPVTGLDMFALAFARMSYSKYHGPLKQMLADARFAYVIRADGRALVRRVDSTIAALVVDASRAAQQPERGSAAAHLRRAYEEAYALHPDSVRAYSESIKAVEAAMHQTLEPNNAKATMGTMLRELRQHPDRFIVAIPGKNGSEGVATIEAMVSLLWTGQASRHGGKGPTQEETEAQARMAVHMAGSLVQWFSTGAIQRK